MELRGELEAAEFGDKRLTTRLLRLAEQLARAPNQSFPKAAGSDAALEATYRFLGNGAVNPASILEPHVAATAERCKAAEADLAVGARYEPYFVFHQANKREAKVGAPRPQRSESSFVATLSLGSSRSAGAASRRGGGRDALTHAGQVWLPKPPSGG